SRLEPPNNHNITPNLILPTNIINHNNIKLQPRTTPTNRFPNPLPNLLSVHKKWQNLNNPKLPSNKQILRYLCCVYI
uniref:Uncharacterized protein n=1 Tax=Ciona intestinalis TaxID=7719 RepID=H2Y3B0_CIOIN